MSVNPMNGDARVLLNARRHRRLIRERSFEEAGNTGQSAFTLIARSLWAIGVSWPGPVLADAAVGEFYYFTTNPSDVRRVRRATSPEEARTRPAERCRVVFLNCAERRVISLAGVISTEQRASARRWNGGWAAVT